MVDVELDCCLEDVECGGYVVVEGCDVGVDVGGWDCVEMYYCVDVVVLIVYCCEGVDDLVVVG